MKDFVFGLDISDRSAEIIALEGKQGSFRVVAAGRCDIPPGTVNLGVVQDNLALTTALAGLFDATFGKKRGKLTAGISLPEMAVYAKTFAFPATLSPDLVRRAVAIEATDIFPIPLSRSATSFAVISRNKESQEVFFAAAEWSVTRAYVDVLTGLGVKIMFMEPEAMSIGRAVMDQRITDPVLVADMGSRSTSLALHDKGVLRMSGAVMVGGDAMTSTIERKLGVTFIEANEMRKKIGFDPSADDARLFLVMEEPMHEIITEIQRTVAYYQDHFGRKVTALILAGGVSLTPQISEYIGSNLPELEIVIGNPLRGISMAGMAHSDDLTSAPVLWSSSLGLAMRAVGARGSPGINLAPVESDNSGGMRGAFNRFISMVTRKKPSARKPKVQKDDQDAIPAALPPASEAVQEVVNPPVRLQIDVAQDAPEAAAEPAPEAEPVKTTAAEPVTGPKEESDFGHGIGDILGSAIDGVSAKTPSFGTHAESSLPVTKPAPPAASYVTESRRSIASILESAAPESSGTYGDSERKSSGGKRVFGLIAAVIFFFAMAAGGVYMLVSKYGMPHLPASISGMFGTAAEPVAVSPSPDSVPAMPDSVNVSVLVSEKEVPDSTIPVLLSRVIETEVKGQGTYSSTGEASAATSPGKSRGKVTIINESAQSYTFVATTRLLSKEGVLFRMVSGSPIPANGSVVVDVAADQPGAAGDIGATTFTIPGLPPATQKVVYGKSDAAMSGGSGTGSKTVRESDIRVAKDTLADKLKVEAMENLKAALADGEILQEDLVTSSEISAIGPTAGAAADKFDISLTVRYRALVIPEKEVTKLLNDALNTAVSAANVVGDYSLGSPLFILDGWNEAGFMQANVRAEATVVGTR